MRTKIQILDGGAVFRFYCSCGHNFKISLWSLVYERTRKGEVIKLRKQDKRNIAKCKCGREYIFVVVPEVLYKLLPMKKAIK